MSGSRLKTGSRLGKSSNGGAPPPAASETVSGILELATQAETDLGTDDTRATTPLKMQNGPKVVNGASETDRIVEYQTDGVTRWRILANSDAEGGSNSGSNLDICPFSDAGALLGHVIRMTRSTLGLLFNGSFHTFNSRIEFDQTTHLGLRLNSLTTAERDAITAVAGDIIFNETTDTIEGFNGTSFVDALAAAAGAGISGFKLADESTTSDTTLSDDADLKFAMEANSDYSFHFWAHVNSTGAGGIKASVNGPAASNNIAYSVSVQTTNSVTNGSTETAYDAATGANGSSVVTIHLHGTIENGANAGDLVFRWAQNTNNISTTTVQRGSHFEATKQ